jgi:outer membrane biogenesis lipoprotein LolB
MIMKRLALIATTGLLALVLTACGEHGNKQPKASDNTQQQGAAPAPQHQPSQEH